MFTIIVAFALIIINYITAEKPSYFHVCNSNDPKYDQCILENIKNFHNKICKGIPELNIPSSDPFVIDKHVISDAPNLKMTLRDIQITGICNSSVIKHVYLDIDQLHFDVEFSFRRLQANATYDIDIRLLVPIVQKGPIYITTNALEGSASLDLKIVTKSGKRYVYISKIKGNFDVKEYYLQHGMNTEANQLNQVINNFIGSNQEEIISFFKPILEESFVKHVLWVTNTALKQYTYDELFPYRV